MAREFSFEVHGHNAALAYQGKGSTVYTAAVRVSKYSAEFGVTSTESHARDERAFYPHRRMYGGFTAQVDCNQYHEFKQLMRWLKNYANRLLDNSAGLIATPMHLSLPSRNVNRLGVLVSGIDDHDHVGSNLFQVPLQFITLSVPSDPAIPLILPQDASRFNKASVDSNISQTFYPVTGNKIVDSNIYDDLNTIDPSQIIDPGPTEMGGGLNRDRAE